MNWRNSQVPKNPSTVLKVLEAAPAHTGKQSSSNGNVFSTR
jgi:hypothetical protein